MTFQRYGFYQLDPAKLTGITYEDGKKLLEDYINRWPEMTRYLLFKERKEPQHAEETAQK